MNSSFCTKTEVRRYFRGKAVTGQDRIIKIIEEMDFFADCTTVMAFSALRGEPNITEGLARWSSMGKRIFLPRVAGDNLEVVEAFFENDTPINLEKTAPYNIMEPMGPAVAPSVIDLILVPGVAFDVHCNRLGRGGGYYDRFLPMVRAIKIGVTGNERLLERLPAEPHDIKVDYVVTPSKIIHFK